MEILITGGKGQLARAFQKFFAQKGLSYQAFSHREFDISDLKAVLSAVRTLRPRVIINCAAYNLVDKAEEDFQEAFRVNTLGPYNLRLAASEVGAFLIHFSTDYLHWLRLNLTGRPSQRGWSRLESSTQNSK